MPESTLTRTQSLLELQRLVVATFDLDELQMVTFALGIDWDELKGTTKSLKIIALIHHTDRRGKIESLLALLREERPELQWPTIQSTDPGPPSIDEPSSGQLTSINVQSQGGGSVNVGNIITGRIDGDVVHGNKVTGGILISGSITGDVHINYTIRPDIPNPPSPYPIPEIPLFVGRDDDIAYFQTMLERSGLAVISGMAGMGKTTLAAVIARRNGPMEKTFWHVFHEGEGIESIIWRLAGFLAWRGQEELWRLLQNTRLTNGRPPPPESLFDYITHLLRGRDYLLCFDDFQHVDEDPLLHQLVDQLRPLLGAGELQMILTTRRMPEFVQRVVAFEPLSGLNLIGIRQLLSAYDISLSDERLDQLYAYTGGNVQLLSLAVDLMRDTGSTGSLLDRLVDADNIERYLLDEVEGRLTRDERLAMGAVAVLQGYPASRQTIEAVLDGRNVRRILRDLADRSLLIVSRVDEERFYTQHAILRDFFYGSLGRAQRMEMHLRAGQFYRGDGADRLLSARHYFLAHSYIEASDLATSDVRSTINQGRAQQLGHLLGEFEPGQLDALRWVAVKLAEGEVYTYLGDSQPARNAYETAVGVVESQPDSDAVRLATARACLGMGELLTQQAPEEGLGWLERGLSLVTGLDSEQEAALTLQMGELYMFTGRFEEAQAALERGQAGLPPGPSQWRASALENLGAVAVMAQGNVAAAYDLAVQALAVSQELEDSFRIARLKSMLGGLKQMSDDWPAAKIELEAAVGIATDLGNQKILAQAAMNYGVLLIYLGDYAGARQQLTVALEAARKTDQLFGVVLTLLSLTDAALRLEEWDEAARYVDEAQKLADELQLVMQMPRILQLRASIALGLEDNQTALSLADESISMARDYDDGPAVGIGERGRGQALARLERWPEAEEAFRQSAAIIERDDRYEAARTNAEWGVALVRRGELESAELLIGQARATFAGLGARGDLDRLQKLVPGSVG